MTGWGRINRRGATTLAAVTLVAIMAAGCTVSASPSPASASPAKTATLTASSTPSALPTATPAPIATPAPTASTRPTIGPLVSGAWTALRWISDGKPAPDPTEEPVKSDEQVPSVYVTSSVFGWSKGYVAFQSTTFSSDGAEDRHSIVAESSADGLSWHVGDLLPGLGDVVSISRVVEGPGGLLALGYGPVAVCGGPARIFGLWTSVDGIAWSSEKLPFGKDSIFTIDAGSAGYIAMGEHSNGEPALWISTNGRNWTSSAVPVSSKTGVVQDATAFSGGFVVVGAVKGDEGCGGPTGLTPSVWSSPDGKSWTKAALPGVPTASDAWMTVSRISDHQLFAMASTNDTATQTTTATCWASADGETWTLVKAPSSVTSFVTNGSRGVSWYSDEKFAWHFWAFEPDGTIRELAQTGVALPSAYVFGGQVALGPAGLVMTDFEGTRFFLGVPTN